MNVQADLAPRQRDAKLDTIIKLAVMAVGGQGGGVLTSWIEALARSQGYAAQATSVAGVAQRTGATIYYVEMAPIGAPKTDPRSTSAETISESGSDSAPLMMSGTGRMPEPGTGKAPQSGPPVPGPMPVFSLAPATGDVDVLIAAEMMEAGRAIIRGFVTPDRTTLIASTHRALAVSEKTVPGDGIASSEEVRAAAEVAAERLVMFDMEKVAVENGSVISSSLFGALAGSGALPFPREAFEDAIRASGKGVEASLRAFGAAYERAKAGEAGEDASEPAATAPPAFTPNGPEKLLVEWEALTARVRALPAPAQDIALHGLRKVVNFQDLAYGRDYLHQVERMAKLDNDAKGYALTAEAAKYVANAMAYDDVIRVADLKTRGARFDRIAREMKAEDKTVQLTEFMHPRAEEIVGMMPAGIGARLEASPKWMARIDRVFNKGRRVRTHRIGSFLTLYILGGLRGWRRRTLRHRYEQAHMDRWLTSCAEAVGEDYDVAVELLRCRRLIKGYSDTHARGLSKFDQVMEAAQLVRGREDAAQWVARLREAALQDEKGEALDGAIRTVRSFA